MSRTHPLFRIWINSDDAAERRHAEFLSSIPEDTPSVAKDITLGSTQKKAKPQVNRAVTATQHGFRNCWFSTRMYNNGCSCMNCHLHSRVIRLEDCLSCFWLTWQLQNENQARMDRPDLEFQAAG